jgi:hypothetical protein
LRKKAFIELKKSFGDDLWSRELKFKIEIFAENSMK